MQDHDLLAKPRPPTADEVWQALAEIPDPEIPDISLVDLGVIKGVAVDGERVRVDFTPTFMGCPALEHMRRAIEEKVEQLGGEPEVRVLLDDSWSTDDISHEGREKLRAAGFAPPAPRQAGKLELVQLQGAAFRCPYCGSTACSRPGRAERASTKRWTSSGRMPSASSTTSFAPSFAAAPRSVSGGRFRTPSRFRATYTRPSSGSSGRR